MVISFGMEAKHFPFSVCCRRTKRIALGFLSLIICLVFLTGPWTESYENEAFNSNTKRSRIPSDLKNRSNSAGDANSPAKENPAPVVHSKEDLEAINAYLKEQEQFCNASMRNKTGQNWCPCIPPNLKGRLIIDTRDSSWEEIDEAVGKDIDVGGEWRPPNCVSHTRLAVIIPCRDRDMHLRVMLRHLIPILQRQLVEFRIFVADQSFPLVFNKASTMNIGFLEAMKRFKFNCVMFHDVDHLLEDDRALMNCGPLPHHYAIGLEEWGYRLIYGGLFGGVITLTPQMFTRVNGYSNKFFGWGGEDDDMGSRVRHFWRVYRPPIQIARYSTVKHSSDSLNPRNNKRMETMSQQWKNYENETFDGLTDLRYTITDVAVTNLFTKIKASIDITNLPYHFNDSIPAKYTKHNGVCLDPESISGTKDVSKVACQYVCDHQSHSPCFGFSYRPDGQTARCSLLSTACHLTTKELGATYVKHVGRSV